MIARRTLILSFMAALLPTTAIAKIVKPPRGSELRKTLLDTLRPIVEYQMRGPVEFVVRKINVIDNAAFVVVEPQRPGGGKINLSDTLFQKEKEFMDGLTVFALLVSNGNRWSVLQHVTGPTDVAYQGWTEFYELPEELIWSD